MAVRAEENLGSHAASSVPAVDLTINPHHGRRGREGDMGEGQRSAVSQCPGKQQSRESGRGSALIWCWLLCLAAAVLGWSVMFGSESVTRVTSVCPAGTVGLGGPSDSAGLLFAHLQAARASASVCSTCALGLGDSRRGRQVPP